MILDLTYQSAFPKLPWMYQSKMFFAFNTSSPYPSYWQSRWLQPGSLILERLRPERLCLVFEPKQLTCGCVGSAQRPPPLPLPPGCHMSCRSSFPRRYLTLFSERLLCPAVLHKWPVFTLPCCFWNEQRNSILTMSITVGHLREASRVG